MHNREDSWSGEWCKDKLETHDKIESIQLQGSNLLSVAHSEFGTITIATMSLEKIDENDLQVLLGTQKVDFVLNVSREPYVTQQALVYAEQNRFSIGGLGDAMRVLRDGDPADYVHREIRFILQGLRQHTNVVNVVRLDNRRFQIDRYDHSPVTILALNEYEITADTVRTAIDRFPKFHAILKSDPNGSITSNAIAAAESAGLEIYAWRDLLGALNKSWQ